MVQTIVPTSAPPPTPPPATPSLPVMPSPPVIASPPITLPPPVTPPQPAASQAIAASHAATAGHATISHTITASHAVIGTYSFVHQSRRHCQACQHQSCHPHESRRHLQSVFTSRAISACHATTHATTCNDWPTHQFKTCKVHPLVCFLLRAACHVGILAVVAPLLSQVFKIVHQADRMYVRT